MRRGDIVWVDFDPSEGREQKKRRPAIVVSNPVAIATVLQRNDGMLTVVPVTSNVAKVFSFQVLLPATRTGLPKDSKALPEQIRAVDFSRVTVQPVGRVSDDLLTHLDNALRTHLAL